MPQRREGEAAEATAAPAGRKTLEVVSGAERIADALALVAAEAERVQVSSDGQSRPRCSVDLHKLHTACTNCSSSHLAHWGGQHAPRRLLTILSIVLCILGAFAAPAQLS